VVELFEVEDVVPVVVEEPEVVEVFVIAATCCEVADVVPEVITAVPEELEGTVTVLVLDVVDEAVELAATTEDDPLKEETEVELEDEEADTRVEELLEPPPKEDVDVVNPEP